MKYIKTKEEERTDTIASILLIVLMVGTFGLYLLFPDEIPLKLNVNDEPVGIQEKHNILMFPGIGIVLFVAFTLISHYLIKYNENEDEFNETVRQRAGTVWLLRLAKLVTITGLIVSVMEIAKVVYHNSKLIATISFILEVAIVGLIFIFVLKQLIAKYRPKR